jgi:hypothetical protein
VASSRSTKISSSFGPAPKCLLQHFFFRPFHVFSQCYPYLLILSFI